SPTTPNSERYLSCSWPSAGRRRRGARPPPIQRRGAAGCAPARKAMRRELPDYLRPALDLVFVGFNPGDRSSRIGHYYAGRGNQFWNFLFASGLVAEKLEPEEDHRILDFGIGLTDVVKRWSPSSSSLRRVDYQRGVPRL